jgi:hypothetical protein
MQKIIAHIVKSAYASSKERGFQGLSWYSYCMIIAAWSTMLVCSQRPRVYMTRKIGGSVAGIYLDIKNTVTCLQYASVSACNSVLHYHIQHQRIYHPPNILYNATQFSKQRISLALLWLWRPPCRQSNAKEPSHPDQQNYRQSA